MGLKSHFFHSEKRLFVFVAEWSKDQYQRWLLSRTYRHRHGSHRLYLQSLQTHLQQVRRGKLNSKKNPPLRKATSDLRSRGEIGHKLVLASLLLLSPLTSHGQTQFSYSATTSDGREELEGRLYFLLSNEFPFLHKPEKREGTSNVLLQGVLQKCFISY